MRRKLKLLFLLVVLILFTSEVPLAQIDEKNLLLALNLDTSGSMAEYWEEAISSLFALIDELQPGDVVLPFRFDTDCWQLKDAQGNPLVIKIRDGEDRVKLRNLFSQLRPRGRWTYLRRGVEIPLRIVAKYRESFDSELPSSLLLVTDGISDPGPGRNKDIDLTSSFLSRVKEKYAVEIFVVHVSKSFVGTKLEPEVLEKLRKEKEALEELERQGVSVAQFVPPGELIPLMKELIALLRENRKLAKDFLKTGWSFQPMAKGDTPDEHSNVFPDKKEPPVRENTTSNSDSDPLSNLLKNTLFLIPIFIIPALTISYLLFRRRKSPELPEEIEDMSTSQVGISVFLLYKGEQVKNRVFEPGSRGKRISIGSGKRDDICFTEDLALKPGHLKLYFSPTGEVEYKLKGKKRELLLDEEILLTEETTAKVKVTTIEKIAEEVI